MTRYRKPPPSGWLTVQDLCDLWPVTEGTILRWCRERLLKSRRFDGRRVMVHHSEAARWELEHPLLREHGGVRS